MSALAAPLLWLAFDAAATGDPLATTHRAEALRGRGRSWADVLEALVDRISPLGFALGALGIAGFVLHARARGRAGALLPAATIVVWPSFSSSRRIAAFRLRTATCCRRSSLSRSASASSSRGSCRECSPPGLPPRSRLRVSSS
jgi:hypothetical protein